MAERTQSKELQEALKKQEVLLVEERAQRQAGETHLQNQLDRINQTQDLLAKGQVTMQIAVVEMLKSQTALHGGIQSNSTSFPKVEFPYFDGVDAKGWIRKCNWYFQVISIFPVDQKVPLASVHFQGKAEVWFQNFIGRRALPSWEELVIALMERFDDVIPELIVGEFHKLQQIGSVQDYYEKFDDINGARGVKVPGMKSLPRVPQHSNSNMVRRFSKPLKPPFSTKVESNPLVKRLLIAAEMKARREKNLCYNCDETYTPGHKCKQRHLFMMMTGEEEEMYGEEIVSSEVVREEVMIEEGKVSLNALLGSMGKGVIRVDGIIVGKPIQILIDSGSTHCFIDEKLAETLSF
ncbi:hypothetical protein CDL12_08254 [Handroanthus impetiginosus]|uniref:Retrotransposon gag domain-containing protein n=1 Tax=Handroanthus impetiginosus TaxID=429701 RepID=A0A2G9HNG9_9LAMI|nr:hypothetical protein CDL12_08254 [Handroanthus impetiginosus]